MPWALEVMKCRWGDCLEQTLAEHSWFGHATFSLPEGQEQRRVNVP